MKYQFPEFLAAFIFTGVIMFIRITAALSIVAIFVVIMALVVNGIDRFFF